MRKVLIVYNPHVSQYRYAINAYLRAGKELGAFAEASPSDLPLPEREYDLCLFYDKDVLLCEECEKRWRTENPAAAIAAADDKAVSYLKLKGVVPQLKTHIMPLSFGYERREEYWNEIEKRVSFPLVAKERKNSFGVGVTLVDSMQALRALTDKRDGFLLQEVAEKGRDIRIFLANGKLIGAMERVNEHDFRSNCERGANAFTYLPSSYEVELAQKAFACLNLTFGGADIIYNGGIAFLLEVNSNAGFKKMDEVLRQESAYLILKELLSL